MESNVLTRLLDSFPGFIQGKLQEPELIRKYRMEGLKHLQKFGLPNRSMEKWRNSAIEGTLNQDFVLDEERPVFDKNVNEIFHCSIHGFTTEVIALLNGWYYSEGPNNLKTNEEGLVVGSLKEAMVAYPSIFQKHFGKIAVHNQHGFSYANMAFFEDGLFIYVPDGVVVKDSIQLIKMINSPQKRMINTRNLIILGRNSYLSLMHCDDSVNHEGSLINTVTEVFMDANAELDLYKLQNINNQTSLINSTTIHQEASSRLNVKVITLNGGAIRNEINVDLQGQGAEADLNGIYLMDGKQQVDNQVMVNHAVPHCNSSELFKGVLDNSSSAIFNGYVHVNRDAQQTNAFQRNNNIIMTPDAKVDTMPFLEIYADDVKCSHGATVGQLDNEALFYLMQRGISHKDARLLLMYAFAAEVTSKIKIEPLKNSIEDMIKKRLRGELSICEKCVLHCSTPDYPVEFDIDLSKI